MARQEAGGVEKPLEDLAPGNPLRGGPAPPGAFALDPDPGGAVERIQTHISHLYLTPSRVYKLRKPVKLSFLDFSTRAARNADCERELRLMKPEAILINTSRGPVIDEPALVRALTEGWIAAAGLDVLDPEPPQPDNPLLKLDNVVLTPHIAGYSDEFPANFWRFSLEAAIDLSKKRWPRSYVNPNVKPRWKLT